ncbi:MAG: NAD-dependent epimerase/dehydratase family protein [Microbacter sp.]
MNILITGIHGFVGSNLVAALKNQHTIYGLDIVAPQKEGVVKTFSWNELELIPAVDVIIHLAGKAHDTKNQTERQVYFDINTGLTEQIYDWFLTTHATKFIFFSSVKAAADKVEGEMLTEDVVPSPKGPYGESKIAAENYILRKLTVDSELSAINYQLKRVYVLRPCMIHGPGNKGNLNLLYQVVKKGIPWPLGAFENRRSFTSIDNLSFVIEQLIEKDISGGIYNVGDDESLSTNELITLMVKVMGKPNRIWKWNKTMIQLAAKVGTVLHLPLNEERLQKLTENYVVSNAKLKKALGIESMLVSAEEGMRKTIESIDN